jgi:SNF2 family DNA or RNA helicase
MLTITDTAIRDLFDSGAYTRGTAYYKQGRVGKLKVTDNIQIDSSIQLNAKVQGSGNSQYSVEVDLWLDVGEELSVDGHCTCPVAYMCKHVVAVMLAYQTTTQATTFSVKREERICFDWLASLEQPAEESHQQEFMAYVLKPSTKLGILELKVMKARHLKSGKGLGKGTVIRDLRSLLARRAYSDDRYITTEDVNIGLLLESCLEGYSGGVSFQGKVGQLVLQKIIDSGRSYWQDLSHGPITQGEKRPLDAQWHFDKADNSSLELTVNPVGRVLITDPPMYLDTENLQVGNIETQLSYPQFQAMVNAPVIPKALRAKVAKSLLNDFPSLPIPPLSKKKIKQLKGIKPVPCLTVFGQKSESISSHHVRLDFSYQAHIIQTLPRNDWQNLEIKNQIVRIQRDALAEESYLQSLLNNNFVTAPIQGDLLLQKDPSHPSSARLLMWQDFLAQGLPQLESEGWQVQFDDSFELEFLDSEDDWYANVEQDEQQNDWFELGFDLPVGKEGKEKLPLLPLITQLLEEYAGEELPETIMLAMSGERYLSISRKKIQPILDILYELHQDRDGTSDTIKLTRHDAARLDSLNNSELNLQWHGAKELLALGKKLNDFDGIKMVAAPQGLNASLRNYQQQGLNWLQFLREYEFNGILADDMGLGKTVQALAHLQVEKEAGRLTNPCLILAPTSLMGNWLREAARFTPDLKALVLHGPQRHDDFKKIKKHDLIITTYPLLVRDEAILLKQKYHYLVLDEAQVIKNPKAKAAQAVRNIKAQHRLCLTGTPMENHLGELWSLFDFLMPGFLLNEKNFKQTFRTPIEKNADDTRRQQLVSRVKPFMLRRTKDIVAQELPQKTEIIQTVSLGSKQAALYESIRLSMEKKVRDAIAKKGLGGSHITILDALLKLRQVCCDPKLLSLEKASKVTESAKLELLMSMVPEMVEEGRKILIFSQFTKMLGLIEEQLKTAGINYSKLTGQTRKRDDAIQAFNEGEAKVFLISLKAGGVGLNLTAADTVIHYDPWWNPAVENQATDRAYRIGQDKPVFVYKLITENTLEEKILARQERKQALANGVYGKQQAQEKISAQDLQALLAPIR